MRDENELCLLCHHFTHVDDRIQTIDRPAAKAGKKKKMSCVRCVPISLTLMGIDPSSQVMLRPGKSASTGRRSTLEIDRL
jgi:hypothetical protein